ncbi:MAG: DNA-binding response regulator, CheY like [Nitrospira sp.]
MYDIFKFYNFLLAHIPTAWSLRVARYMPLYPSLLLIDDSSGERELFREALARTGLAVALFAEQDAEAALRFLTHRASLGLPPSVILLDWHLRCWSGDEFLRHLRAHPGVTTIPVVVFSTSDAAADVSAAYTNGANGYVVKPDTFDELVRCIRTICQFWVDCNVSPHLIESRC